MGVGDYIDAEPPRQGEYKPYSPLVEGQRPGAASAVRQFFYGAVGITCHLEVRRYALGNSGRLLPLDLRVAGFCKTRNRNLPRRIKPSEVAWRRFVPQTGALIQ